jgi:tetrahydromethanopterin S-methyltransferase subunit F
VGCGNQEEYYNCADIAILPRRRRRPKKMPKPPTKKSTNITAKEKPKVDKIQTIAPSKDVKTMSKPPTKKSTNITAKEKPKVDKIQTIAPSIKFGFAAR